MPSTSLNRLAHRKDPGRGCLGPLADLLPGTKIFVLSRVFFVLLGLNFFLSPAWAQRVNLAKYQASTASATTSTYRPDFAVDGIVCNFHSFRSSGRFWLEISYPRPIAIASAHLYSGLLENNTTEVLASFRFQYHDGAGWLDISGSLVTGNTRPERAVVFTNPVTATRFRLQSNDASGSRTIRELALFPPNVVGGVEQGFPLGTDVNLNLALKRTATASSAQLANTNGAGYPKNAIDGFLDNRSRWLVQPTNNNVYLSGEFLEVDLLAINSIGSAHVYSGIMNSNRVSGAAIPNFELQYLSGTSWLPVPGASITNNTNTSLVIPFTTNVAASRVRLVTTTATPARLQELLLFPPRPGGYPIGREIRNADPGTNTWERLSDSYYRIRNAGPDLRIGLVGGAVVNVAVETNHPLRTEWQLLLNHRDGTYRVRHAESGLCLAIARDLTGRISLSNNTQVVAEEYTALPHQDWRMVYANPTNFSLVNAYSGLAIQPAGSSWSAGTPLVVSAGAANNVTQLWTAAFRRPYPKKGIAGTINKSPFNPAITFHRDFYDRLGPGSWSYNWGRSFATNFPYLSANHVYNPMQWGNFSWNHGSAQGPMENLHRELQADPKPTYFMGFNEPEKEEQGLISVEEAIMRWPRFEARDVPLVSPVPASTFSEWNTNFFNQARDNGYRIDHWSVHWYAGPNASSLINVLGRAYTNYGFRPIWLTEFSVVPWSPGEWSDKSNFDFLAEFMWRAEGLSWLKRYSLFAFTDGGSTNNPDLPTAPRSDAFNADGSLTPFGELYAGWDGVTNVVTNRAYHLHAHGAYRRGHNAGGASAPAAVSPTNSLAGLQWTLAPATTTTNTNTFRIISTRDGRPLRYVDGPSNPVTFGLSGETGAPVEWSFVPDQHGLYYIQHPASANKRLELAGDSSTFTMAASNNTSAVSKWRLVGPAVAENASFPATPAGLSATGEVASIALSWEPASSAFSYTVERFDTMEQIWQPMAEGLAQTAWTDSGLPGDATYSYRVTARNLLGTSLPSITATATTTHPLANFAAWQAQYFTNPAPEESGANADPDRDGLGNLLEYAFAASPHHPTGIAPLTIRHAQGGVTIIFPWNWRAADIVWRIKHGTSLADRASWAEVQNATVQKFREGDVDRMEVTVPITNPEREFFYLEVIAE